MITSESTSFSFGLSIRLYGEKKVQLSRFKTQSHEYLGVSGARKKALLTDFSPQMVYFPIPSSLFVVHEPFYGVTLILRPNQQPFFDSFSPPCERSEG